MSKKEKTAPEAEQKKVVTKYDLKVQKRKEAEAKKKREALKGKIIMAVIIVAALAFILSFPIRRYLALNGTYITVGEEKITQVEFDYNYAVAKASYWETYGSTLSMFGMDITTIEEQLYDGTLTFKQYFEQLAVQNIVNTKALKNAAEAENFVYDTTMDYEKFIADLSMDAAAAGVSLNEYISSTFGSLATEARLEEIIKETLYTAAFYKQKAENSKPSESDILAYYEANKSDFDSVDYHMTTIKAQLPTEGVQESKPEAEDDGTAEYEPTAEEIAAAMAEAKKEAEEAVKTVAAEGDAYTNQTRAAINSNISSWLFEDGRKAGDTYIAEDTINNAYIVVAFDKRYRDDAPGADMRIIMTTATDSKTILAEWESGAKTEDSFIQLVSKYDEAGSAAYGGLYEGLSAALLPEGMDDWAGDSARKAGDTFAINVEGDTNYVCYYVGASDPSWKNSISDTLLSQVMANYLNDLSQGYEVKEGRGKLAYLHPEELIADTTVDAVPVE